MPTRMPSFSRSSSESKKKPPPPFHAPQSTLEVNFEVLHSEALILTGKISFHYFNSLKENNEINVKEM